MDTKQNQQNKSLFNREIFGIPCIQIAAGKEQACIAAQGAQILSWINSDGQEKLYVSPQTLSLDSSHERNKLGPAIRGGVPICFPQFSDRGVMMKHGFVRNRIWTLDEGKRSPEDDSAAASSVTLRFSEDQATREMWPHRFCAQANIEIHPGELCIRLQVHNSGSEPFLFTAALHTYLRVADIRQTSLQGLQGISFEDATKANLLSIQKEAQLRIPDETDRVYLDPPKELMLFEGDKASLRISQAGFADTVVWNPGPAKAKALADFPDDDWLQMLCVEAACVAKPVALQPGESWTGSQTLAMP